jgi:hypothetical protein
MSEPTTSPSTARAELAAAVCALPERMGWWFVAASLLFWTVLWPVGLLAAAVWLIARSRRLRRLQAPVERRIARLLRWYPAGWRERYGDEFAALLRDTLEDGRGGLRLWLDVARAGIVARAEDGGRQRLLAGLLLTVGWIPLFPQGLVPLVMQLTGVPARSWFLALYLPQPLQWLTAVAMVALGLAMLLAGLRIAARLASEGRQAPVRQL